jgi:hypothetical protein
MGQRTDQRTIEILWRASWLFTPADGHAITVIDNLDPFHDDHRSYEISPTSSSHGRWHVVDVDLRHRVSLSRELDERYDVIAHFREAGLRIDWRGTFVSLELAGQPEWAGQPCL